jgi:hypothetical protein
MSWEDVVVMVIGGEMVVGMVVTMTAGWCVGDRGGDDGDHNDE